MTDRQLSAEDIGRELLRKLAGVQPAGHLNWLPLAELVRFFIQIHSASPDGGLPEKVDGRDFRVALAGELHRLRDDVRWMVAFEAGEIETMGYDEIPRGFLIRSALQYLKDDLAGTVAADLVDDDSFEEADEKLVRGHFDLVPAEMIPDHLPASHWWWDDSVREAMPDQIRLYRYGEASGDLRPAFYIADRDYPRPDLAAAARDEAFAMLNRNRIIGEVVTTERNRPAGVPTWAEFKQRHVTEGVPLPVRGQSANPGTPPAWDAMMAELRRAWEASRAELDAIIQSAFPGAPIQVNSDAGPERVSRGSVDKSEESWGFRQSLMTFPDFPNGLPPQVETAAMADQLTQRGWQVGPATPSGDVLLLEATRDHSRIAVRAKGTSVGVQLLSAAYRAPAGSNNWVTEVRQ